VEVVDHLVRVRATARRDGRQLPERATRYGANNELHFWFTEQWTILLLSGTGSNRNAGVVHKVLDYLVAGCCFVWSNDTSFRIRQALRVYKEWLRANHLPNTWTSTKQSSSR